MATVQNICTRVSRKLNDQQKGFEFTRWTREDLINYCSEALQQVSTYRPDAFTDVQNVTLTPGVRQKLPPGVNSLASVLDNNDPDNPLAVMRDDVGLVRVFGKKPCLYNLDTQGNVTYRMTAYSYDPRTPGYFFVSPPVPSGMKTPAVVGISAVMDPPELDKTWWTKQIPINSNKYYNAIFAWMLASAYSVETESETSFKLMQLYAASFYKMMGVKYQMESKFGSAWYLGQRGYESNVRGDL